jgi:hypothetical protein
MKLEDGRVTTEASLWATRGALPLPSVGGEGSASEEGVNCSHAGSSPSGREELEPAAKNGVEWGLRLEAGAGAASGALGREGAGPPSPVGGVAGDVEGGGERSLSHQTSLPLSLSLSSNFSETLERSFTKTKNFTTKNIGRCCGKKIVHQTERRQIGSSFV